MWYASLESWSVVLRASPRIFTAREDSRRRDRRDRQGEESNIWLIPDGWVAQGSEEELDL